MAATAFRKKDLPKLKPANGNEPPTKTQIRDWQRLTRQICRSEGVEWIFKTAEAMQLDEDTQEYYLADPDEEDSVAEMEDEAIDVHNKRNQLHQ